MEFSISGSVNVERVSGKFASAEDIRDIIQEAVDEAIGQLDLSSIGPDSDSEYMADGECEVEHVPATKRKKAKKGA